MKGAEPKSFGPIASFYDQLMDVVPYRMWVSYYLLLLSQQEIKPKTMLDVCCGTGTMSELLYDEGFEIDGFDISEPMIQVAKEKAELSLRNISYYVNDARTVDIGKTYDAAFSFFDSLNYITSAEGLRQAILHIAKHVKSGGSLIFDLNTAYAFEAGLFDQQNLSKKSQVRYDWRSEYDAASRLISVNMRFWKDGEEVREVHQQRAHHPDEVQSFLAEAGFGSVRCYHSYTLDPPRRKSDRVHWTAVKL